MNKINKAAKVLNNGGIIIFPTDTAFGIGCRIDKPSSIKKLFEIRKRPINQATPVLVGSIEMAREYVNDIPSDVLEKLINVYWPGVLTIILEAKIEKVPKLVRGMSTTIGLRMPNNKNILEVIEKVGVPILGPSANFHGKDTPFNLEDLDSDLLSLVDFVLEGECSIKNASTVIDCTVAPWKILRKGAIDINI